ncbi:MAG: hypothetical protein RCG15_02780 [Candidatus Rickettsia vulgarisii]
MDNNHIFEEKVNQKTTLAYFLIECAWPACFYFAYVHCGNILKNNFNFSSEEIDLSKFYSIINSICWMDSSNIFEY